MNAVVDGPVPATRAMMLSDVDTVVALETATYPFPWTAGIFRDCLRVGYFCRVIEVDDRLAGYGIMSVGIGEAHVLNICIDGAFQRQGLGRALLGHMLAVARTRGAATAFLEVRPSNVVALRMYEGAGFGRIGIRKAYYQSASGREDAIVLSKRLV